VNHQQEAARDRTSVTEPPVSFGQGGPAPSPAVGQERPTRSPGSVPISGASDPGSRRLVDGGAGALPAEPTEGRVFGPLRYDGPFRVSPETPCPAVLDGVRCPLPKGHPGYHFRKAGAR
jgi:hypothetical protein